MADPIQPAGQTAFVTDPYGQRREVPAEYVPSLVASGYKALDPEAQETARAEAQYGGFGQGLTAYGEHAASSATFGASDWLERVLGVKPEDMAGRQMAHPAASFLGTLTGIAAPMLATMGASTPESIAAAGGRAVAGAGERAAAAAANPLSRAALTELMGAPGAAATAQGGGALRALASASAPGIIGKIGRGVSQELGAALPEVESTAGRILQKAATVGLGGAVEGAAYEVGNQIHEAALGNPDLTAEVVLSHVGLGALAGGGLGALIGAGEVAIPAAIARARAAYDSALTGVEGVAERVATRYSEKWHGTPKPLMEVLLEHKLEFSQLEKQSPGLIDTLRAGTADAAESVARNAAAIGAFEREVPGSAKILARYPADTLAFVLEHEQQFMPMLKKWPDAIVRMQHADPKMAGFLLDNYPRIIEGSLESGKLATKVQRKLQGLLDSTRGVFNHAYGDMMREGAPELLVGANPAKIIAHYETVRAEVQGAIDMMRDPANQALYNQAFPRKLELIMQGLEAQSAKYPLGQAAAPKVAFDRLTLLRQQIGDLRYFGDVTKLPLNEREAQPVLEHLYRKTSEALKDPAAFGEAARQKAILDDLYHQWLKEVKRDAGARNLNYLLMTNGKFFSANKLGQFFNQLNQGQGEERLAALSNFLRMSQRAIDAAEALHKAAPSASFDREAAQELLDHTRGVWASGKKRLKVTAQWKSLDPRKAGGQNYAAPPAGNAAEDIATGMKMAQKASEHAGSIGGVIGSVVKVVAKPFEVGGDASKTTQVLASLHRVGMKTADGIEKGAKLAVRGGVRAAYVGRGEAAAGIGSQFAKGPDDSLSKYRQRTSILARLSDPDALHELLTEQHHDIAEHAPNTALALGVKTATAVQFLLSKLPQHERTPLGPDPQPSPAEIARFNRYWEAVEKPLTILKQAAAGTLSPEALETATAVYPELLQQIRATVLDEVASHRGPVPHQTRIMLSMLLGQDMDGTLTPSFLQSTQSVYASPSNRTPDQGGGFGPPAIKPSAPATQRMKTPMRALTPSQASAQRGR